MKHDHGQVDKLNGRFAFNRAKSAGWFAFDSFCSKEGRKSSALSPHNLMSSQTQTLSQHTVANQTSESHRPNLTAWQLDGWAACHIKLEKHPTSCASSFIKDQDSVGSKEDPEPG